ncbi:hypothetical protein B484DRAFT_38566, partial [Ochromonadaceae sp. CCMP2298]
MDGGVDDRAAKADLSDVSDLSDAEEEEGDTSKLAPVLESLTLDDVPYSRDLQWINVASGARPVISQSRSRQGNATAGTVADTDRIRRSDKKFLVDVGVTDGARGGRTRSRRKRGARGGRGASEISKGDSRGGSMGGSKAESGSRGGSRGDSRGGGGGRGGSRERDWRESPKVPVAMSLDDIPYDRDLQWMNVPTGARPRPPPPPAGTGTGVTQSRRSRGRNGGAVLEREAGQVGFMGGVGGEGEVSVREKKLVDVSDASNRPERNRMERNRPSRAEGRRWKAGLTGDGGQTQLDRQDGDMGGTVGGRGGGGGGGGGGV